MKNISRLLLVTLGLVAVFTVACGDDVTTPPPIVCGCIPAYKDLSHKTDVLFNFEMAHNKRDNDHYNALMDDNFTFFYTEADANGTTQVQWGRIEDMTATSGLFGAALSIVMDIVFEDGVTWSARPVGDETWYDTTVYYHFTIKIGDTTYIPNAGAKMQFTIRNAGTNEAPKWKLIELHDLGGPSLVSVRSAAATQPTTYGQVKALYR